MKKEFYFLIGLFLLASNSAFAQSSQIFTDKSGTTIELDINEMAFAEEAFSNQRLRHSQRDPNNLVGPPNVAKGMKWPNKQVMSLGCRGHVKAVFNSVGFYDGPGADLVVFEGGSVFEPTTIAISTDGVQWVRLGTIGGGKSAIDIKKPETEGKIFHYVLLRDKGSHCRYTPNDGADIDAIAAINYKAVEQEKVVILPVKKEKSKKEAEQGDPKFDVEFKATKVDFTVFPNPTSSELNVKFDLENEAKISARIFNQAGKTIHHLLTNEVRLAGTQTINYALGTLAAGTYYVQLVVDDKSVVKKLMVVE